MVAIGVLLADAQTFLSSMPYDTRVTLCCSDLDVLHMPSRIHDCPAVMSLRLEFVSGGGGPWFNIDWSVIWPSAQAAAPASASSSASAEAAAGLPPPACCKRKKRLTRMEQPHGEPDELYCTQNLDVAVVYCIDSLSLL